MAYGNGGNGQRPVQGQTGSGFVKKTTPVVNSTTTVAGDEKPRNSLFKAFKNKGLGYSTTLKEDVTIPAGTKVAIFEDILKGKDGTEYHVLNVKKMPPREA